MITPLPTPPTTSDPANFQSRADAFVAALPQMVAEINAALVSVPYIPGQREVLTGPRTYYVRTDGSDANNGLSNAAAGAFASVQTAIETVCRLDFAGNSVTIQLAAGTYAPFSFLTNAWVGSGSLIILGDTATPSNVKITATNNNCIYVQVALPGLLQVRGLQLSTVTAGDCLISFGSGDIAFQNCAFGACAGSHITSGRPGAQIGASGPYSIVGAAQIHVTAASGGVVSITGAAVTITGTPAFTSAFAFAQSAGVVSAAGATFSGSATGPRHFGSGNGVISTAGVTLPGSVAGTLQTGAEIV